MKNWQVSLLVESIEPELISVLKKQPSGQSFLFVWGLLLLVRQIRSSLPKGDYKVLNPCTFLHKV